MPKRKHQEAASSSTPSLSRLAQDELIRNLEESILSERASVSFVCGGTIPMQKNPRNASPSPSQQSNPEEKPLKNDQPIRDNQEAPPINIFWAKEDDIAARKRILPLDSFPIADSSTERLSQLVSDCEPASFGRGKKDVLDPEYRRAGKLDTNRYASNFDLADYGIIENVEIILLPRFNSEADKNWLGLSFRKLSAEMYKLNVYSGPNGLFRKHVDTPRSEGQIGSLVVCLPSPFKGGDLMVRHDGHEVNFRWDSNSADTIQWAAFYSDCEHEIKTITDGQRITLTYNLFVTEPFVESIAASPFMDTKTLPLYRFLRDALSGPGFMKEGGNIGIWCSHSYPHNTEQATQILPRVLKGSDLVMCAALESSGIEVKILPAFVMKEMHEDPEQIGHGITPEPAHDWLEFISPEDNDSEDEKGKKGKNMKGKFDQYSDWDPIAIHIGEGLKKHTIENWEHELEYGDEQAFLKPNFGGKVDKDIIWIAGPRHRKLALTLMTWGNQAELTTIYSYAVIIAKIPPFFGSQRAKAFQDSS